MMDVKPIIMQRSILMKNMIHVRRKNLIVIKEYSFIYELSAKNIHLHVSPKGKHMCIKFYFLQKNSVSGQTVIPLLNIMPHFRLNVLPLCVFWKYLINIINLIVCDECKSKQKLLKLLWNIQKINRHHCHHLRCLTFRIFSDLLEHLMVSCRRHIV